MDIWSRCHCVTFPNPQYLLVEDGYGPMELQQVGRTVLMGRGGYMGEEHQNK